jgi:hypothetical protein
VWGECAAIARDTAELIGPLAAETAVAAVHEKVAGEISALSAREEVAAVIAGQEVAGLLGACKVAAARWVERRPTFETIA